MIQLPKLEKIKPESFGDFDKVLDEFLPYLTLTSEQVPDVATWENGMEYDMIIEVRQSGSTLDKVSGITRADMKIIAYKVLKEKSIEEMDDKEFEDYQDKQLVKMAAVRGSSISNNLDSRK